MKSKKWSLTRAVLVIGGILLLIGATVITISHEQNIKTSKKQSTRYADTLRTLIPEPQSAFPEERRDNTMSVLPLNGTDFVGILEMPSFNSSLPVGAIWGKSSEFPCRLGGSVYDGTIKIGATSQDGQFDFYNEISVGDTIYFTDMEGNRFSYAVTDIKHEKHANQTTLNSKDASFTLFIKNMYSFEYIIIFCDTLK